MQEMRFLLTMLFTVNLVAAASASLDPSRRLADGNATCARVRKPWGSLTTQEQSLYVEALGEAIKSGVATSFAEMHLEALGEQQAHQSCGFLAWHRRMLLAFESYLRDLQPKYACLTIPYYDVHSAYVDFANKKCTNMYDCSPIFKGIGGPATSKTEKTLVYSTEEATGLPVKGKPFTSNCDDQKKQCGAVLRNDLSNKAVPSGAGFASFLEIVTKSDGYASFLEGIQFGVHNEVHNAVGGVMATFASPRDVFFYSWHSAIDMYLSVYHQCRVGGLSDGSKSSQEAFAQAAQTCGGKGGVGADTTIVMNLQWNGTYVDATAHPTLGKYFTKAGSSMWSYGDTTTLGESSYSYELPAIMQTQILSNRDVCKAPPTPAPTTSAPTTPPATTSAPTTPAPTTSAPTTPAPTTSAPTTTKPQSTKAPSTPAPTTSAPTTPPPTTTKPLSTPAPTTAAPSKYSSYTVHRPTPPPHNGIIVVPASPSAPAAYAPSVATTGSYWEWTQATYSGLVSRFNGDMAMVTEQMRAIECLTFDRLYGVATYSDKFVATFHLSSKRPSCGHRVDAVANGTLTVAATTPAAFKAQAVEFKGPTVIANIQEADKKKKANKGRERSYDRPCPMAKRGY